MAFASLRCTDDADDTSATTAAEVEAARSPVEEVTVDPLTGAETRRVRLADAWMIFVFLGAEMTFVPLVDA